MAEEDVYKGKKMITWGSLIFLLNCLICCLSAFCLVLAQGEQAARAKLRLAAGWVHPP